MSSDHAQHRFRLLLGPHQHFDLASSCVVKKNHPTVNCFLLLMGDPGDISQPACYAVRSSNCGLVDRAADGPSTGVCAWRAAGVCAWRTRDCKAFFSKRFFLKISAKSQDEAVGMRKG